MRRRRFNATYMDSKMKKSLLVCFMLCVACVGAAFGQVLSLGTSETIRSTILNENRTLFVSLPSGYDESKERYPLLILLDADWRFRRTSAAVENMADGEVMPKTIVVGIVNTQRDRDLTPAFNGDAYAPSGADDFLRFIKEEVIPFADSHYRTRPYRILVGHSHAGFFTLYALMREKNLFDAYISLSPSRGLDERNLKNLDLLLTRQERLRKFVYIGYGGKESEEIYLGAIRYAKIFDNHADKGIDARAEMFPHDNHGSVVHKAMNNAFEYLSYWNAVFPKSGATLLTPEQQKRKAIVERFGYDFRSVPPPRISIARPMMTLLERKERSALETVWRYLQAHERESFIFDPVELDNLGRYLRANNRNEEAEAVFDLIRATAPRYHPGTLSGNNYGHEVDLGRGLAAYYPLDGDAMDQSGNGNDGKVHGAVAVADRKGNPHGAFHFDGKGNSIEVANSPTLNITGSLTISAWIKPAKKEMYASWVSKALAGSSQWRVGFGAGENQWGLTLFTTDWKDFFLKESAIPAGEWSHVVVCADQTLGRLTYSVNGRMAGEMSNLMPFIPGGGPLLIGQQRDDHVFFDGAIDDVRIYSRVLGEREVRALWEGR